MAPVLDWLGHHLAVSHGAALLHAHLLHND